MPQNLKKAIVASAFLCAIYPSISLAQNVVNYQASDLTPRSEISITPATGTFVEGSTFDVPILLNTKGLSVNAVDITVTFDPKILSIVQPSGGKSIIGLWVQPPSFDNTKGTASIAGVVPGGVTSNSGLIVGITFKAKAPGQVTVRIADTSRVLLNNGIGTETVVDSNRGVYTVIPKPPEGVVVFSDSHPFQDHWYNDSNATLSWTKDPGVSGFSYVLDNKPNTVPSNSITDTETSKTYESVGDGISYFHIKAIKNGVWGATTDYVLRIDTIPPAKFTPMIGYLTANTLDRFLVSFFTTDSLSGIDHYEVGTIDKSRPASETPIFTESASPYQLPVSVSNARVIVRAFDQAGNVQEAYIDTRVPFSFIGFITSHVQGILAVLLIFIVARMAFHHFATNRNGGKPRSVVDLPVGRAKRIK